MARHDRDAKFSAHVYDEQEVAKILIELDRYLSAFEATHTQLKKALAPALELNL